MMFADTSEDRPSVFVVDDDPVASAFAGAAARHAELPVRHFDCAETFLAGVTDADRGCVILDLFMQGMNGLQLQAELARRGVRMPVIVVSGRGDVSSAVAAMKQDAFDYFEKPVDLAILVASIRRAVIADTDRALDRAGSDTVRRRYATLTPREKQVMAAVTDGLANKQIAARFELSEKTIEVHRGNVMRKMDVDSVAALVRAAIACEAPSPPPNSI